MQLMVNQVESEGHLSPVYPADRSTVRSTPAMDVRVCSIIRLSNAEQRVRGRMWSNVMK